MTSLKGYYLKWYDNLVLDLLEWQEAAKIILEIESLSDEFNRQFLTEILLNCEKDQTQEDLLVKYLELGIYDVYTEALETLTGGKEPIELPFSDLPISEKVLNYLRDSGNNRLIKENSIQILNLIYRLGNLLTLGRYMQIVGISDEDYLRLSCMTTNNFQMFLYFYQGITDKEQKEYMLNNHINHASKEFFVQLMDEFPTSDKRKWLLSLMNHTYHWEGRFISLVFAIQDQGGKLTSDEINDWIDKYPPHLQKELQSNKYLDVDQTEFGIYTTGNQCLSWFKEHFPYLLNQEQLTRIST